MRYEKGRKDRTRSHIINIASRQFRAEGIETTGIASLMAAAGLTVGGFYSHFKSKEDLIREAVVTAADETLRRLDAKDDGTKRNLREILEYYLDVSHRDKPQIGCAIAALASELKDRPLKTRSVVAQKNGDYIKLIADRLPPEASAEMRLRIAASIWAMMVGTLQLSRIVRDQAQSAQILKDGISNALRLAAGVEL